MNTSSYASSGIAKFKERMQKNGRIINKEAQQPAAHPTAGKAMEKKKSSSSQNKPQEMKMKLKKKVFGFGAPQDFTTRAEVVEAKISPPVSNVIDGHTGMTASFAMKETFDAIQAKLDSAQRKIDLGNFERTQKKKVNEFTEAIPESLEEAVEFKKPVSGRSSRRSKSVRRIEDYDLTPENDGGNDEDFEFTPTGTGYSAYSKKTRFGSTDDQGNRLSNLPGEGRPSLTSVTPYDDYAEELVNKVETIIQNSKSKKVKEEKRGIAPIRHNEVNIDAQNTLAKIKTDNEKIMQSKAVVKNDGKQLERKNYVKLNANKSGKYKPASRGAAFTNKIMAKKSNQMKFRGRIEQKLNAERAAHNVGAHGGLGAMGLDFGEHGVDSKAKAKELEGSFSGAARQYAPKILNSDDELDEEDDLLNEDNLEQIGKELEAIDDQVKSQDDENTTKPNIEDKDAAAYQIPKDDQGYIDVLQARFGHQDFLEGQLKAVKLIIEEKENALVVLATGGGKSLCYQYVTQFLPGLVLVVTPLISLMTDQLGKLPDFIPGCALNSQQSFATKKAVMKAVQDYKIKVLFITPERLFMEDLSKFGRKISMVCVDEIHCSSEWSHNFRPAYLVLHDMIKEKLGADTRVIGLTATATKAAQQQICEIFDVKYPDNIVTQPDLSRLNLQLSITRDTEKTTALLQLLRSPSFKGLTSILIFATQRVTTDRIAQLLNQSGIRSSSYHAGKTDDARSYIQKEFIQNRIRVLCCTIAFSMGIDKSDIQSVIHYDVPRSIENYVQEIGRAGRDGKLARCHMFLSNDDFYQLRRITLSDLLDNQSALLLTNHVIIEAKKTFYKVINGEPIKENKKRKRKDISADTDSEEEKENNKLMKEFEFENKIQNMYKPANDHGLKFIDVNEVEEFEQRSLYVSLDVKSLLRDLDLKKEVVLTMLNQMEKLQEGKNFFRVDSILPIGVQLRFHAKPLEELVKTSNNKFYEAFEQIADNRQGIYRCNLIELAEKLEVKPYNIPKLLYQLQHHTKDDIAYSLDQESFILQFQKIPSASHVFELSQEMLLETRKIEKNLVQKLNCMYFSARKVSLPSVDYMMKKEKELEDPSGMYIDFSKRLNTLINLYFQGRKGEDIELKIAGSQEERALMMPLLYIEDEQTREDLSGDMKELLDDYTGPSNKLKRNKLMNPSLRMKPIDVVKVLMGIRSTREAVQKYTYDSRYWAKQHEYDYEQVLQLAEDTTHKFYMELLSELEDENQNPDKRLKLQDELLTDLTNKNKRQCDV